MQDYKKLKIWQKSHSLVLDLFEQCKRFPKEEQYYLVSQLKRSSVSVAANIAEGCGKRTTKDLINFLHISLGSLNETEYFIILSNDLGFINSDSALEKLKNINEIQAMIIGFINKLKSSSNK